MMQGHEREREDEGMSIDIKCANKCVSAAQALLVAIQGVQRLTQTENDSERVRLKDNAIRTCRDAIATLEEIEASPNA